MRLSLRFVVPLLLALAALAYAVAPIVDRLTLQWFTRDLDLRANMIANAANEPLAALVDSGGPRRLVAFFNRLTRDERLYAIGYCAPGARAVIATPRFPPEIRCDSLARFESPASRRITTERGLFHVAVPVTDHVPAGGRLVLVHDMSFVGRRTQQTRKYLFYFFIALGVTVATITVVVAELSWRGWVASFRALVRGQGLPSVSEGRGPPGLQPVAHDLRLLIRDLEAAHTPRDNDRLAWSAATLRDVLYAQLRTHEIIVASNREPYLHRREDGAIRIMRPASGVVTALEPVMRACGGTWVAHGGAPADREVVDTHDRVAVPPDAPAYQLRRVWMTAEEESGYYYGFSNEGLWPLCHNAHVRPTFRSADWSMYQRVNDRFARTVAEEARTADPIVLVQDYHLALAPRLLRKLLPSATIVTFWHIPWPNPESFAICPWREELLDGLLGSSILGFHTQFHCNNFLDTVDRLVEARVDRETFSVSYRGMLTAVKRYPISIEWPPSGELLAAAVPESRAAVRARYALPAGHRLGVGVERLDYTKGIEERFRAVERLLELHPEMVGHFTFVQIAAPSRSQIPEYQAYEQRVRRTADAINSRFGHGGTPAIVLRIEHLEPAEIYEHYRAADLCFVSSLHDGMNLVAKEFVASRDDDAGVLVLSRFTGAARELSEALIVNPYDADECAAALQVALTMPAAEQRDRMRLMRALLRDFNVFRWAGNMLHDALAMRRQDRIRRRSNDVATL